MKSSEHSVEAATESRPSRPSATKRLVGIGMTAILGLSACGDHSTMTKGIVVDKYHEPEHSWVQILPIPQVECTTINNNSFCSTDFLYIPFVHVDDEDWVLRLRDCGEQIEAAEPPQCQDGIVYVDRSTFSELHIGDFYTASPGQTEDHITKQQQ